MSVAPMKNTAQLQSHTCLKIENLSLQLSEKSILHDVSLAMPATGITSLIGPSGAGKSSLLRCINLLYEDWQGDISIHQTMIKKWQGAGVVCSNQEQAQAIQE